MTEPSNNEPNDASNGESTSGILYLIGKYNILQGAFGVIAGAMIALGGTWYFTKNPHLTYSDNPIVAFKGDKNSFGISTCIIENDGDKEIENIECDIKTYAAKPTEIKVTPDSLSPKIETKASGIRITVPYLNKNEKLTVSVLLENAAELGEHLDITVRGKGVTGDKQKHNSSDYIRLIIVLSLTIINTILILIGFRLASRITKNRFRKVVVQSMALEKSHGLLMKELIEMKSESADRDRRHAEDYADMAKRFRRYIEADVTKDDLVVLADGFDEISRTIIGRQKGHSENTAEKPN